MPTACSKNIHIAYEEHGNRNAPAIIFIHGLGMPLTAWPDSWHQFFVNSGYRVIRVDNRDSGQSDELTHLPVPSVGQILKASLFNKIIPCAYTLEDMSDDIIAVMDHLRIKKAHIVGVSMGGMISQYLMIQHAARIRSVTLMMTMSGNRSLPHPSMRVQWQLIRQPRHKNSAKIAKRLEKLWKTIGSPAYLPSPVELSTYVSGLMQRGFYPEGTLRQLGAILGEGDRSPLLQQAKLPVFIIHGQSDPLLPLPCGKQLASVIPHAQLHTEPGMGHDLPKPIEKKLMAMILKHISEHL
ncbi:Aclacinomycin methylesterase RdmC [invertebrate metagenome]|uniref:Aclacinomycin methylesterase RdmC n=1 Tax=invertebrate metagenome TaxID=1711999 RepID=A0A2H9T583_9ZZZZ